MPQLSPIASALDRCLTLMDRAAPHPDDRDAWHTTQRIAALLLARSADIDSTRRKIFLGDLTLLALSLALGLTLGATAALTLL